MTVATYLKNFSVESLVLAVGSLLLFLIVIGLHLRNLRWVRQIANSEASKETRQRLERLIASVERMTASGKPAIAKRARPVNKGRKYVSALRAPKAITPRRKHN